MVIPLANLLGLSDIIWACDEIKCALKVLLCIIITTIGTIMRKTAARLDGSKREPQFTRVQKVLVVSSLSSAMLVLSFPQQKAFAVLEVCVSLLFLVDGWRTFLSFLATSKKTFRVVSRVRGRSSSQAPNFQVKQAYKKYKVLRRNIVGLLFFTTYNVALWVLLSPLFRSNRIASCELRSVDTAPIEILRFYLYGVQIVFQFAYTCHSTFIFTAGKRRKSKLKKLEVLDGATPVGATTASYANKDSVVA